MSDQIPDAESIRETLEILADREFLAELQESIRQADAGELIPLEDVARKYGVSLDGAPGG